MVVSSIPPDETGRISNPPGNANRLEKDAIMGSKI